MNKDFVQNLYNRYGGKKQYWDVIFIEKKYFKIINDNMIKKSTKRISDIKERIIKDIKKNNFTKKYQITSLYEYNCIKDYINELDIDINYELLWCHGDQQMNKLDKIIEGDYTCCRDCDRPMKFINKKTYVIYCYFSKI